MIFTFPDSSRWEVEFVKEGLAHNVFLEFLFYHQIGWETLVVAIDDRILIIKFDGLPWIAILKIFTIPVNLGSLFEC